MKFRALTFALAASAFAMAAGAGEVALTPLSPDAYAVRAQSGADAPFVLDVRSVDEFVSGHVPGAVNIPHDQVAARLAEVPKDREVVLYCRSGRRAALAADVLAASGYARLAHLEGDMPAWEASGHPVEKPSNPAACAAALKSGESVAKACASN